MRESKPEVGRLVRSLAGRDAGRYMLIYSVSDNDYVNVVDGRTHKISDPKKKKLKHLRTLPFIDTDVLKNVDEAAGTGDSDVRKAIEKLLRVRDAENTGSGHKE